MRLHRSCVLLVLLATGVIGRAASLQDTIIQVNTRLVEINVVVRDKNGPVANLTTEDFTVLDNGKAQRIAVFASSESRNKLQANFGTLAAGAVSNLRDSTGEVPGSATVILLDLLNSASEGQSGNTAALNNLSALNDQRDAIKELVGYLRTIREGDRVALFVLGNRLHVVQDFTGDSGILLRAAARIKALDLAGIEVSSQEQLAAVLEPPPVSNVDGSVTNVGTPGFANAISVGSTLARVDATTEAFESIARHLSGLPGRKNLVWISAGFPFKPVVAQRIVGRQAQAPVETPDDFSTQLKQVSKTLNDANVSIYPVDYQGLKGGYPEVMMRLADATGGHVAYRTNDLKGAVGAAVADGDVSYTLGFYPDAKSFDGKLHELKVKVNRKNVEVHHRSGYYASANPALTEKERQSVLAELIGSELNSSQIGLIVAGERNIANGTYRIRVTVDAAGLDLTQQGDRWAGKLGLATRLESSKSKNATLSSIPINLTDEQYRTVMKSGMVFQQTIEATPGDRLRIIAQDETSGLTGAVWLPLRK
jgi:VWFA-related protein